MISRKKQTYEDREMKKPLFYDGIHYSILSATMTYDKIYNTLLAVSKSGYELIKSGRGLGNLSLDPATSLCMTTNSWTMIDSLWRLVCLLHDTPNLKQNSPELRKFYIRYEPVIKYTRDIIEHLDDNLGGYIEKKMPAWGSLSWISTISESDKSSLLFVWVPGSLPGHTIDCYMVNPSETPCRIPIDLITLYAVRTVNLSELNERVRELAGWLEKCTGRSFTSNPYYSLVAGDYDWSNTGANEGVRINPSDYLSIRIEKKV